MRRGLLLLALVMGCQQKAPQPKAQLALAAAPTQLLVIGYFHATGATQIADTASYGTTKAGHLLAPTVTVDTIILPLPTANTTGTFSIRTGNSSSWSGAVSKSWSYTAPPPAGFTMSVPTLTVRAANAKGDSVWLKANWTQSAWPSTSDSALVDYKRAGVSVMSPGYKHTRNMTVDSVKKASLAAAGQTQTFQTCVWAKNYATGVDMVESTNCSGIVSWTNAAVQPPPPPAVDSMRLYPTRAYVDTANPVGTSYKLAGLAETARAGFISTTNKTWSNIQFCTFVRDSATKAWGRVANDTGVARCNNLFAALPLSPKLAIKTVIPSNKQLKVAIEEKNGVITPVATRSR